MILEDRGGEPEPVVDTAQRVPQDQRRLLPRPAIRGPPPWRDDVQLECVLIDVRPLRRRLDQQRQLVIVVRGTDVVDPDHPTAALVHDLHRYRTRGGLDPAHERPHRREVVGRPRPRLVPTSRAEQLARVVITP